MKIRVKFRKFGPLRFIGHLDVMRYFQKAIRRADIDIAYTSGFSPHQIMTFAAPLGVGLESNGEYMDIECRSVTTSQDMMDRLNRAGAPGIQVVSVKRLPEGAGNAMASVAAASYTVRFREGREPGFLHEDTMEQWIWKFLSQEQILVSKETKTGVHEVDIRPGIYEMRVAAADEGAAAEEEMFSAEEEMAATEKFGVASGALKKAVLPPIYMLVDASSAGNLKPGKVMEAFCAAFGENLQENALRITREETYMRLGTGRSAEATMEAGGTKKIEKAGGTERTGEIEEAKRSEGTGEVKRSEGTGEAERIGGVKGAGERNDIGSGLVPLDSIGEEITGTADGEESA